MEKWIIGVVGSIAASLLTYWLLSTPVDVTIVAVEVPTKEPPPGKLTAKITLFNPGDKPTSKCELRWDTGLNTISAPISYFVLPSKATTDIETWNIIPAELLPESGILHVESIVTVECDDIRKVDLKYFRIKDVKLFRNYVTPRYLDKKASADFKIEPKYKRNLTHCEPDDEVIACVYKMADARYEELAEEHYVKVCVDDYTIEDCIRLTALSKYKEWMKQYLKPSIINEQQEIFSEKFLEKIGVNIELLSNVK